MAGLVARAARWVRPRLGGPAGCVVYSLALLLLAAVLALLAAALVPGVLRSLP